MGLFLILKFTASRKSLELISQREIKRRHAPFFRTEVAPLPVNTTSDCTARSSSEAMGDREPREEFKIGYGIPMAQPGWLHVFLAAETDLQILSDRPSAWDQHQDVIVCTRRARQ